MKDDPLISVIIPVYNVEQYLERCLKSVLNQTYSSLEIILVDDGSTDCSGAICDRYQEKEERIRVVHKKNGGLSSARNTGLTLAHGNYVGFVDSDDWIHPEMYEKLLQLIQKGAHDISVCGIVRVASEFESVDQPYPAGEKIISGKEFQKKILKAGTQNSNQYAVNKLYKKAVANHIIYPEGLTDEDVEGTFRAMLFAGTIIVTDWIGYFYYINPQSITRQKFSHKNFDFLEICDHLVELAETYCDEEIKNDAVVFRKRADFSILCRIALWGDLNGLELLNKKNKIIADMRKNYFQLLKTNIPFGRKLLMTGFCINFNWTGNMMRFIYQNSQLLQKEH